jgi:hypothetical protein
MRTPIEHAILERTSQVRLDVALESISEDYCSRARRRFGTQDLDALSKLLRVTEVRTCDIPYEGLLRPASNGTYVIMLSEQSTPERRRFSWAHELGHAILHRMVPETRSIETRLFVQPWRDAEELACDRLAAAMLMPRDSFMRHALKLRFSVHSLVKLSRLFDVSLTAAARRIHDLFPRADFSMVRLRRLSEDRVVYSNFLCNFKRGRLSLDTNLPVSPELEWAYHECKSFGDWQWLRRFNRRRRLFVSLSRLRESGIALAMITRDSKIPNASFFALSRAAASE